MESQLAAPVLWVRALFAGTFAFFLGTAGHLMANGLLPRPAFLVVLYAFTVVLSVPILARPASHLRMLVLMVGGQTFIHVCLTLSAGHVGDPTTSTGPRPHDAGLTQLPVVDGHRVGSFQDAWVGSNAMPSTTPTLPIHHLVAAALVALWMSYGDKRLFAVLAVTARLLGALVRPDVPVVVRPSTWRATLTEVAVAGFRDVLLCRSVSRRGPPLLAG